jgi:hypothetical protein
MGQEYGKKDILKIVYCEFYIADILITIFYYILKSEIVSFQH